MGTVEEFKKWMRRVNIVMAARIGVTADDLPDQLWRDRFEDGLSVEGAVEMGIEEAGEEMGIDLSEI